MPNKVGYIPHFPCPDVPANTLMQHNNFQGSDKPKVFWTDVPEGDFFVNSDAFFNAVPYSNPIRYPQRNELIRFPRCVRFSFPFTTTPGQAAATSELTGIYGSFASQVRDMVNSISPAIYVQFPNHDFYGGLILPNDSTYPSTDYLDETCFLLSDTLSFVLFGINTGGFLADDDGNSPRTIVAPKTEWYNYLNYANTQYPLFPRYRTIVQAQFDVGAYPNLQLVDTTDSRNGSRQTLNHIFNATLGFSKPLGFELGPDFTFNLGYMESVIKAHWNLT